MINRWSDAEAEAFIAPYIKQSGRALAMRMYSARLLGADRRLVLHGGGNTSVKDEFRNRIGDTIEAVFVKASGVDMAMIDADGHVGLDLNYLRRLAAIESMSDEEMINEFRTHMFNASSATPSVETLLHVFLPFKYIDHTHADAILTLANQANAGQLIKQALGEDVLTVDYYTPGFKLAKAVLAAFNGKPDCTAIVLAHHGIVTWGDTARNSYNKMIELVTAAEAYINKHTTAPPKRRGAVSPDEARQRYIKIAPILRGLLAVDSGNEDQPFTRVILTPLIDDDTLDYIGSDIGRETALTPPVTSDYLIRTKTYPLWIDGLNFDNMDELSAQLSGAIEGYKRRYEDYLALHAAAEEISRFDAMPRVIYIEGVGAVCTGKDIKAAAIAADITRQSIEIKSAAAHMGGKFEGISDQAIFEMEYRTYQHAKLGSADSQPLSGETAIITGAAGAIGSAIARELLLNGCHVAITDLPGVRLDSLYKELRTSFGKSVMAVPMDVTSSESVLSACARVIELWGGLDIVIVNAGIAMVSSLAGMSIEAFQRLERVNIDGTLLIIAEAARHFNIQKTGGDIVLISTKNVFSPSANFGAYSVTKAAAHQVARIASLELAGMGVRVNMVTPDGVFSDGRRRSGLWEEIGPDRMRARGLDEKGLEDYYRGRNLLKARITACHVAKAVLFFATRATPTTGATIPVDGGLPDAVPR
ncbi:MAG: bifunctional aldolase/short-chain dehydrogenase [Candidatus Magnetominusculus sp. LBB02]|nr:bifunctional aldolase/short-chain dehydrogenase [Candidatus Magnetominusculus sp. LBB02]